jgi:hypothetical protein
MKKTIALVLAVLAIAAAASASAGRVSHSARGACCAQPA